MLLFLFCVPEVICRPRTIYLSKALSLFGPPLDENGRSMFYDFRGDYVAMTQSSTGYSYTQLGYGAPNSSGMLVSKDKIDSDSYRIDYRLRFHKLARSQKRGGGASFFITKDPSIAEGSVFGISGELSGLLVVLGFSDASNGRPYIAAVAGGDIKYNPRGRNATTKTSINGAFLDDEQERVLRIDVDGSKVSISFGKPREEEEVLALRNVAIGRDHHIGISALHQDSSPLVRLYGIRFYVEKFIQGRPGMEEVSRQRVGGKFVWAALFLVSFGLGYYLFSNYRKYK